MQGSSYKIIDRGRKQGICRSLGRGVCRGAGLTLLVAACLFNLSYQPLPKTAGPQLPPEIAQQLRHYQSADDLTAWIYQQIQWVATAPAARAAQLDQARMTAWRYPRSNEEIQAWQDLLNNEGYALLMSGDIVHSTDAYTAAFQWARQHKELADATLVLENILKPLGNNYTRLGDFEQALFIQGKALAIAKTLENKEALAGVYSNLANISSNRGLPGQSLDYCRQGLAAVDPHSALCGLLLSEQADACEQLQEYHTARTSIRKSIAILQRSTSGKQTSPEAGYWLLMAYQQAGDIYSEDPELALQFYAKALSWQNRLSQLHGAIHQREQAKLLQRLGALCLRTGRMDKAGYWLDQCLSVLIPHKKVDSLQESDLFAENTLMDLLFTLADLSHSQQHTDKALHFYQLCFATEKKIRYELITGSSKERSVSDSRLRYEKAIHTAWESWVNTGQKKYQRQMLEFMESSKSQLLLEEIIHQRSGDSLQNRIRLLERALVYYRKEGMQAGLGDSLTHLRAKQEQQTQWDLAELRKKAGMIQVIPVPDPASTGPTAPSDTTSLYSCLKEGQVARSFFTGAAATYTVEFSQSGISFIEKLPLDIHGQDSIRAFIHTYFEEGANAMINRPGAYYQQAYSIYRLLFGSHSLLPGKEYILIPDGPLNLLPFEALVTNPSSPASPDKWPFLIRQSLISYAWSLRTLQQQVQTQGYGKGAAGFFLSGNQDHGKSPLLTTVLREKTAMAATLGNGNWYLDKEATTTAFRKALQESALVHISSHAFTKKDSLEAPHIELFDEPFYLFELKGLDSRPALVVLSACRTGDGRMVSGEGVQSLARAFTAGGANAVIAGWWNVNDEAAAQLMQGFYTALISGQPPAGPGPSSAISGQPALDAAMALRQSKLNWLDAAGVSYLHKLPYYWAALNYQGNPLPLSVGSLTEKDSRHFARWWWWLWALPLCGLFIPALRRRRRSR